MGKLSNQLFHNAEALATQGRKAKQTVVDVLDEILVDLCPDGVVPMQGYSTVERLVKVICFLDQVHFDEHCCGLVIRPLKSGDNVKAWIESRKALIKADNDEAYLIGGYTVDQLYRLLKSALPDEFRGVIEKEWDQDRMKRINGEWMTQDKKRLCSI